MTFVIELVFIINALLLLQWHKPLLHLFLRLVLLRLLQASYGRSQILILVSLKASAFFGAIASASLFKLHFVRILNYIIIWCLLHTRRSIFFKEIIILSLLWASSIRELYVRVLLEICVVKYLSARGMFPELLLLV